MRPIVTLDNSRTSGLLFGQARISNNTQDRLNGGADERKLRGDATYIE
jgi:hypothetical protein